jgi:ubiquinone/menaquinone biosynthesis C-methylase UbiE
MTQETSVADYNAKVGAYYDEDSAQFESRYRVNETARKIRNSFREETEKFQFTQALEIGFGPGVDLVYYGKKYPDRIFYGVDVSAGMLAYASGKVQKAGLSNVVLMQGSVETLAEDIGGKKFDLIYVYFGALNTVTDLALAAGSIEQVLAPGGKLVITTINKWHLAGMLVPMFKGRFSIAFQRLRKIWGGYSPGRHLDSKCYTPRDIARAFSSFDVIRRRGYSVVFPAWYQDDLRPKLGRLYEWLWKADNLLNRTFLWSKGEYTLFVLTRK